jgi:DNA-directed RNA polymerase specialized sigma24 family protein
MSELTMPSRPNRLSQLSTSWTLLRQAHDAAASTEERAKAHSQLIDRYGYVIRQYLGGALRHVAGDRQEAVEECYSRFCLRLAEGRLGRADRARGRFRDYLRGILANIVTDYKRERAKAFKSVEVRDMPEPDPEGDKRQFQEWFAEGLVARAMEELRRQDEKRKRAYYAVLHARIAHPDWSSEQLAAELSEPGVKRSIGWVRINLARARKELCRFLELEVAQDLVDASPSAVQEELSNIGLLVYCQ